MDVYPPAATWTQAVDQLPQAGRSDLACESCKNRKAKCDRIRPSCTLCDKMAKACVYPSKRMKPGPKMGSRQCRRRRFRGANNSSSSKSPVYENTEDEVGLGHDEFATGQTAKGHRQVRTTGNLIDPGISPALPNPGDSGTDWGDSSDSSDEVATNFVRAISLSSLIHPDHELYTKTPEDVSQTRTDGFFISLAGAQDLITQVCATMDLSLSTFQSLIDLYFENMTSLALFHQPSFGVKVQKIKNGLHLKVLFASIFSFSSRFYAKPSDSEFLTSSGRCSSPDQFQQMALKLIDEVLGEDPDGTPPLCVLQAMVLCTFNELIRGVRGRAWRLLGTCVRIAYEQRLHLVDYGAQTGVPTTDLDLRRWSANEEKRRCWWTIWEMDVFASTIRRSPTAITWSMNETYLPVETDLWFQNKYRQSCFLALAPEDRWQKLKMTRNEGFSAWFIVLNSLMWDAQVLARGSLQGVRCQTDATENATSLRAYFHNAFRNKGSPDDAEKLPILLRALQKTTAAIPDALKYRGGTLDFGNGELDTSTAPDGQPKKQLKRQLHADQYALFSIVQLARFQIYHHYAFGEIVSGYIFAAESNDVSSERPATQHRSQRSLATCKGLRECFGAADDILDIVKNCSDDHVQWLNPFLASTVWLAASLQVLRKVYASKGTRTRDQLSESRHAVLQLACRRYEMFWGTPHALVENLDSLEARLIDAKNRAGKTKAGYERNGTLQNLPGPGDTSSPTSSSRTATLRSRQLADVSREELAPCRAEGPVARGVFHVPYAADIYPQTEAQGSLPPVTIPASNALFNEPAGVQQRERNASNANDYPESALDPSLYFSMDAIEVWDGIGNFSNNFDWGIPHAL